AYIAKQAAGECDHIFTANHDGSGAESLIDLYDALENFTDDPSGPELCHVNALRYSENGDYFTVSDREKDVIVKISRSGEVLESYGKAPNPDVSWSHFLADGSGTTWRVQHGHHLYAPDKLLVFSNGPFGNGTSRV